MNTQRHITLWLCAVLISGCASLGVAPAQTFSQKLSYAVGLHTAILQATTVSVTSGALSSSDAQAILTQADTARAVLDTAQAANAAGDLTGANNKLAAALVVLNALQAFLNTHGSK